MKNEVNRAPVAKKKKILFMSSAKLTAVSLGVLLVIFCTIGMSFTPGDEGDIVEPNDTTALADRPGPRKSHWTTSGSCGGTNYNNNKDYGKVAVTVVGGTGGTVSASGNNGTSSTASNNTTSVTVTWNCGYSDTSNHTDLTAKHTNKITFTASPSTGYNFEGWYTDAACTQLKSSDLSYSEDFVIDHGSWGTGQDSEYESSSKAQTWNRYAKFVEIEPVDLTFIAPAAGGQYTVTVGGSSSTVSSANVVKTGITTEVTLEATPASGYMFAGWYQVDGDGNVTDLGTTVSYNKTFAKSVSVGARFISTSTSKFKNITKNAEYYGLRLAILAASANDVIIPVAEETVVDGSDLLPVDNGTYTLPAGVKLLIPYSSANDFQTLPKVVTSAATLSPYKKLILMDGVNIVVNSGAQICVAGQAMAGSGGSPSGYTTGACGVLDMSRGGHMELNDGSTLYCWGFVKGQDMDQGNNTVGVGTIFVNSGATVWETFSVGDWRGGSATSSIVNTRFFPFQSYFMQNIEVPTTYWEGSSEWCYFTLNATGGPYDTKFAVIGSSNCLFKLTDAQSKVRKWYDPTTDLMCYELSGSAVLDELKIKITGIPLIGTIDIQSSQFDLPIPSNMHLILANCNMNLTKPLIVQPGAIIEIKNSATVTLSTNLYMYDKDDWGPWVCGKYFKATSNLTTHKNRGDGSKNDLLDDAKFIIDGSFTISSAGKLFSTAGGAALVGNGGGTLAYPSSLSGSSTLKWYKSTTTSGDGETGTVAVNNANPCNEDESYTKAIASKTFLNIHGRWFNQTDGASTINADHTYNFTYIASGAVSGTGGTDVSPNTHNALYAPDKTGLAAGMKWCNVVQDGTCSNIFNATQALNETPASDIRYTYPSSSWLQLLRTETEGVYGGSDNSLYAVDGCAVNSLGSVDENCLYTINDVKKALVDGHFVALEKNTEDEAWHDVANPTNYYICFEGCNWHPATKYAGEEKAYIVEEGDYIWYNNNWLLVEREDPFFFDYNDQNVKRYYEYEDGAWGLAEPRVRVVDAIETRDFYKLPEAITVASGKKNTTITILKDISGINAEMTYTAKNTTCTLDLNGHTVSGACAKLLTINASGTTFTITDNSEGKTGRLENIFNQNAVTYNVTVTAGTLNIPYGTIHAENPAQYASKAATVNNVAVTALTACGARAVQVAAAQKLNISGGRLEAYATRNAYGIVASGNNANTTQVTITDGEIYAEAPCGAYGISCSGKLNISGGLVEAKLNDHLVDASYAADNASNNLNKHQTCYTIIMGGSANATASSCFYGTLTVTGGTIKASSDLERSYTANVFAIYMNISVAGKGNRNYASTSGTNAEQACAVGSVKNATIDVFTKGNYGYGIYVLGKYNSKDKTNTVFKVENTNVTVKAYNYAYGIYSCGGINGTTGECYTGDVELTNNTVYAEAYKAAGAYATWVWAGYATIYQDKQANYYGEYAAGAKMTINSGTYTAKTKTTSAYATGTSLRAKSIYAPTSSTTWGPGEGKEALATLIINGGTFNATAGSYTARGVSSGGNTTIKDATFNVVATTYYAYGLYAQSGKLTATNVIVNDTAKGRVSSSDNNAYAYGAMADISTITSGNQAWTGYSCAGEIELNNCTINAVASAYTNARGVMVNAGSAMMTRANFENQKTSSGWSAATYNTYNSVFPVQVQGKDSVWVGVAGKITVNGGTYTVKTKTTTAYGAFVNRALKYSYTKPNTILEEFQGTLDINNATFDVKTEGTTTAEGIRSYGQTTITDGSFTVKPKTATAYGIKLYAGKTTVNGNPEFNVTATTTAYGILVGGGEQPSSTTGATYNGEVEVNGGTFNVETTTDKPAYGVYVYGNSRSITSTAAGYYAGNYASAGKATINDGVFNVKSKKTEAYGIAVNAVVNQSGASGYDAATANPKCFVNGGKFKVEGTSSLYMVNSSATAENFQISGGYYSHNTNLNKYKVSPKKVLTLRSTHSLYPDYKYTINEGGTVTWKNGTTTLKTEMYERGETPEYTGETPTKADDAEYAYTHNGWSPAVTAMENSDVTYTATFSKTENKYTVSIEAGEHGSVSPASVSNVGCETASGDITATPNVGYSFSGWTLPTGVTLAEGYELTSNPVRIHATAADKTITANFVARTDINYTVKHWQQNIANDEYTEVTADRQTLQGTTATLTAATAKTYTGFTALPITQETIAGNGSTIVNIYYNRNTFTITWFDGNGNAVETDENVKYGATPEYNGETPTKAATAKYTYTFNNTWSPAITSVTGDATYTAQFGSTVNDYTITWVDGNGETLKTEQVAYGQTPAYTGATPTKTATAQYTYTFNNTWSPAITSVTGDATYTAQFGSTVNEYTIIWVDGNGETLKTEQVAYGQTPAYTGATPTKTATAQYTYTFNNTWSPAITSVTGDATYTAQFGSTVNEYTITWVDGNGETLKTEQVAYGQTPAYTGATPTKTATTAQYTYTFSGWSPAIASVTGEATYTAQFNETVRKYTITWLDDADNVIDYTEVAYGQTPKYDASKPSDGCWNYTFDKWTPAIASVTEDATYKASFTKNAIEYTITWQNVDGTVLIETHSVCDDNPSYPSLYYGLPTHPTSPLLYEFSGWKYERTGVVYSIEDELPLPEGDEIIYTAQYELINNLDVESAQTISVNAEVNVTTVRVEGNLTVDKSKTLTTTDLILEGTPTSSGQITGAGTVSATRALFHFAQPGGFKARTWYAVAVPWQVYVPVSELGGVYLKKGEGDYVQQILGKTYDLIYYDGYRRSQGENKAWNYVEDDQLERKHYEMKPGTAYMIYLTTDADTIRFERKENAELHTNSLQAHTYESPIDEAYANWNGIANPATYHAYLNVGATDGRGQVYNPDTKQYELFDMSAKQLVVGQPIFVQSAVDGTVVANSTTYSPSLAPRRSKAWSAPLTRYELMLAASEADVTDRVIVRMDEDKEEDAYIVGQDLVKMGVSSVVPQMWIDRYDSKMCINTVAGFNHTADYPLGIFAPKDGEYNLFMDDQPNDETMLYLTYDGEAIWNLSYGGYVTYLTKGTDTHYGLRIVAHKPQITTGIEETTIHNGDPIRKVMVDGKVYIIRNGEIYSVTGQKTK